MNCALLLAGGCGTRFGQEVPKQFALVKGKPVISYTLDVFQNHPMIDMIYAVCVKGWEEELWQCAKASGITKLRRVIEGGISAIDSTWKGICALKEEAGIDDLVVIHDAVRPLVSREIISGCLTIASQKGNAITVCPCWEDIFFSADGMSSSEGYLDRRHCFTSQSPHAARLGDIACQISAAMERGLPEPHYYSTLLSDLGVEIFLNKGSRLNFKITTHEDLILFESILGSR